MTCRLRSGCHLSPTHRSLRALLTFFAFPAIQYLLLRAFSRKEGQPEPWFLPAYGFRLVLRNIPRKKTLTDIRYRAFVRRMVGSSGGSSVATLDDRRLSAGEDMVLFPGVDQILLSFKLSRDPGDLERGTLEFSNTDKLGGEQSAIEVRPADRLVYDYSATIQNFFNFDVQIGKRVEVYGSSMFENSKRYN